MMKTYLQPKTHLLQLLSADIMQLGLVSPTPKPTSDIVIISGHVTYGQEDAL